MARAGKGAAEARALGEGRRSDLCPFCGSAVAGEAGALIVGGRASPLQVRRTGARKLFGQERKEVFLAWFAATANVGFAAEQADVTRQTVSKHRLRYPEFDAAYREAIELGVPDLQARLQAWVNGRPKLDVHGALAEPDEAAFDPQLALQILREQGRIMAAGPGGPGRPLKRGRGPRVASNEEVRVALVKALRVFGERVDGAGASEGAAEG